MVRQERCTSRHVRADIVEMMIWRHIAGFISAPGAALEALSAERRQGDTQAERTRQRAPEAQIGHL